LIDPPAVESDSLHAQAIIHRGYFYTKYKDTPILSELFISSLKWDKWIAKNDIDCKRGMLWLVEDPRNEKRLKSNIADLYDHITNLHAVDNFFLVNPTDFGGLTDAKKSFEALRDKSRVDHFYAVNQVTVRPSTVLRALHNGIPGKSLEGRVRPANVTVFATGASEYDNRMSTAPNRIVLVLSSPSLPAISIVVDKCVPIPQTDKKAAAVIVSHENVNGEVVWLLDSEAFSTATREDGASDSKISIDSVLSDRETLTAIIKRLSFLFQGVDKDSIKIGAFEGYLHSFSKNEDQPLEKRCVKEINDGSFACFSERFTLAPLLAEKLAAQLGLSPKANPSAVDPLPIEGEFLKDSWATIKLEPLRTLFDQLS
jgi:hypothetical protein